MNTLKAFFAALKACKAVYDYLKELDRRGSARFSDECARHDRLRLEEWLYRLSYGQDKGWRKAMQIDNSFARYAQLLMKSSKLETMSNGSSLEKAKVREAFHGI